MKRFGLSVLFSYVLILAAVPDAGAEAQTCYTMSEAEAEQGIRIHSELMVIGLNCQHMYSAGGRNLYAQYRAFTNEHARIFADYERELMRFFSRLGLDAESRINSLRTQFANKISNDAARMRPDLFCHQYAPRIIDVADMTGYDLRRWASTFFESHPVSYPICEQ